MAEEPSSKRTPVLAYATPSRRHGRPVAAFAVFILGMFFGWVGFSTLYLAVVGIVTTMRYSISADVGADIEQSIILIIGLMCVVASIHYCRAARGIASGEDRDTIDIKDATYRQ